MPLKLDDFHQIALGIHADRLETCLFERFLIPVVELIAVAMALDDHFLAIQRARSRALQQLAVVAAQAHRAAGLLESLLIGHEVDHGVRRLRVKFGGIGHLQAEHIARKLNHGDLHAQTDAQIGDFMLTRVFRGQLLALDAAVAEAAGHEYAVHALKRLVEIGVRRGQIVGLDPLDVDAGAMIDAAVLERLDDGEIRVVQLDILAHQRDGHLALRLLEAINQPRPVGQIGNALFHMKCLAHLVGEALLFEHQRHLIQRFRIEILDDEARGHVAEAGQLFAHALGDGIIAAADQHAGLYAHGLQRLDRVLRGLGFQLLAALEVRNQRNMNKQHVVAIIFPLELTNRLDEGLTLDITDGAADLGDDDVAILTDAMELVLDFVGNVGNDLHRAAIVSAAALAVQNGIEDLSGGH